MSPAPASFEAAHHEAVGALLLLRVSDHRLDRRAAQPIEGETVFGSRLAVYALALAWHQGLRYRPRGGGASRREALPVFLLGGDQQTAVRCLGGGIGLRPIAGVGQGRAEGGVCAATAATMAAGPASIPTTHHLLAQLPQGGRFGCGEAATRARSTHPHCD